MKDPVIWADELSETTRFEPDDLQRVISCLRANNTSDDDILDFIIKVNSDEYISSHNLSQMCYALTSKAKPLTINQLRVLVCKKPYSSTN